MDNCESAKTCKGCVNLTPSYKGKGFCRAKQKFVSSKTKACKEYEGIETSMNQGGRIR